MNMKKFLTILICSLLIAAFLIPEINIHSTEAEEEDTRNHIIVSIGDSYASGEGIPPFHGTEMIQNWSYLKPTDWLAHRSKKSWAGLLKFDPLKGTMEDHFGTNWFFVAASGATTENLYNPQKRTVKRDALDVLFDLPDYIPGVEAGYWLEPQLNVFTYLESKGLQADYVTVSLGGNDVEFSTIIIETALLGGYLGHYGLKSKIESLWKEFDQTIQYKIKNAYRSIAKRAGEDATVIIVGYPHLLGAREDNPWFNSWEALYINNQVTEFNYRLKEIVESLNSENLNIVFVSVEEAFSGHEAYSHEAVTDDIVVPGEWMNRILRPQPLDLDQTAIASAYSIHPNETGAKNYAECVQSKIYILEEERKSLAPGWSNAYRRFIYKEDYLTFQNVSYGKDSNSIYFGLYDLDLNGVPELFIGNGTDAHMGGGCHVYTFSGGSIRYLGEITCWPGSYEDVGLYYFDNDTYTGLFWEEAFQGVRYRNYYYLDENGKLCTELVEMGEYDDWDHTEGYGDDYHLRQRTDDSALLALSREAERIRFRPYSYKILSFNGWDKYVKLYHDLKGSLSRPKGYTPTGAFGNYEIEVTPTPGQESNITPTPGQESSITPTPGQESSITPTPDQSSKTSLLDKLLSNSHVKEIGMTFEELDATYGPMEFLYLGTEEPIEAFFANAPSGPVRYYFENVGDIPQDLWDEASRNDGKISPSSAKSILSDTDICTGIGGTFKTLGVSKLKDYKSEFTDDARYFDELFGLYRYMVGYRNYDFYANCSEGSKKLKEDNWVDIMLPYDSWPERNTSERGDNGSSEPVPPVTQDEPETETASKWHYDPYAALNSAEDVLNTIEGKGAIYVSKLLRNGGLTNIKKDGAGDLIDYLNKPKNWDGETIGKVVTDPSYSELEVGDVLCSVCSKDGDAGNYTNGHGKGKNLYYGIQVFFVSEVGPDYVRVYSKHNDRHNEIIRLSCNGGDFTDSCGKCGNSKNTRWIAFCFNDAVKAQQSKTESQPDKKTLKAKEGGFNDTDEPMVGFFADGNGNRVPLGFGAYDDMDEWVAVGQANEIVCNTPDVEAYGFFDVDRDGIKELIMKTGTYEAEYKYEFFRYDIDYLGNWGWVGSIGGGHSELYDDNGSLIKDNSHMGSQTLVRVDMSGGKLKETVFAQYEIGEDEDYVDMGYKPVYLCTKNIYLDYLP